MQKSFSSRVLQRFMSDAEIEELTKRYTDNKKTFGSGDKRENSLIQPITDQDMTLLRDYLFHSDKSYHALKQEHNITDVRGSTAKIAFRYLYQKVKNL